MTPRIRIGLSEKPGQSDRYYVSGMPLGYVAAGFPFGIGQELAKVEEGYHNAVKLVERYFGRLSIPSDRLDIRFEG